MPEEAHEAGQLRPQLNQFDAVATGLAAILGAGIFTVIAPAARIAGPALLISLVVAAFVAFCNAMSSAQLARVLPRTGGTYQFGRRMLGPWCGFGAGWMFITANTLGPGVIAIAFGLYLHSAWTAIPSRLAAVAMTMAVTALNAGGIKRSVRVTDVIVLLSVAALVMVVAAGLPAGSTDSFQPWAPHGILGILNASGLLFFAYTGYSRIATLVEEVHDPDRTIPRATVAALGIAVALYLLVAGTAISVLGTTRLANASAPLIRTLMVAGVGIAPALIIAGALLTTFNEALSDLLGVSRVIFAMAREGDLPAMLSRLSPGQNPRQSVLAAGAAACLVAAFAPFTAAVAISSFGTLAYYTVTNMSALRLEKSQRLVPRWLAWAGLLGCVTLALTLATYQVLVGLGLLAAGIVYRLVWMATETKRNH